MDKLKFETPDMVSGNIDKIAVLFPSAITEMRGEDGEIRRGVNFEVLKQLLSREVVDGNECYEFTWVGKKAAMAEAARPITKTLRPVKEDSRDWDTTENLYIEGDNLEVLKLLQESYLGKVKMIYIDPPYNTGNDFIYADDFMRSQEEENEQMGMYDEDENRLFKNTDTNGRFHSDWCSMIYSRLMLARNLLSEDGVIFVKEKLIESAVKMLDEKLNVTTVTVKLEYGEQAARLDSKEQLEQGHGFHRTLSDQEAPKTAPLGSVRYDLIGKLVEETKLTRATIAAILQRMAPQKFAMFRLNPEEFILKTAKIINDQMATQIIEHITYNKLDAAYDTDIFTSANLRGKLGLNAMEANRSLYSHIIYDSENEKRFAGELDVNAKVAVYVKLPGGFFISTPVGKYNPDWAIAFNEGSVKHIYFIAETKGNSDAAELRGVENAKIACAKAHFAAISSESVTYSVVDSFAELMNIVS